MNPMQMINPLRRGSVKPREPGPAGAEKVGSAETSRSLPGASDSAKPTGEEKRGSAHVDRPSPAASTSSRQVSEEKGGSAVAGRSTSGTSSKTRSIQGRIEEESLSEDSESDEKNDTTTNTLQMRQTVETNTAGPSTDSEASKAAGADKTNSALSDSQEVGTTPTVGISELTEVLITKPK